MNRSVNSRFQTVFWTRFVALALLLGCLLVGREVEAQVSFTPAGNITPSSTSFITPTHEGNADTALTVDILQKTLFAKTLLEHQYCEYVIKKRDEGVLPNRILYSAYRHAIKQDKDRRFTHFDISLQKLCREADIDTDTVQTSRRFFRAAPSITAAPKPTMSKFTEAAKSGFATFFNVFKR